MGIAGRRGELRERPVCFIGDVTHVSVFTAREEAARVIAEEIDTGATAAISNGNRMAALRGKERLRDLGAGCLDISTNGRPAHISANEGDE